MLRFFLDFLRVLGLFDDGTNNLELIRRDA